MAGLLSRIIENKTNISRISIAIVYIWFGIPKILGVSSAEGVVTDLQEILLPFIPSATFLIVLGLFEVVLGIGFLLPKFTKYVTILFFLHMFTTFMPLIFLIDQAWDYPFILSLEGQYIVKNIVLMALALNIYADWEKEISNLPKVEQP